MFCAITLGVGVDYAIHLTAAHRRSRRAGVDDPVAALDEAGPPILTDTAVICVSFAWMAISTVPANVRLGMLVAIALGTACVLTLVGLGSFWAWRREVKIPRDLWAERAPEGPASEPAL